MSQTEMPPPPPAAKPSGPAQAWPSHRGYQAFRAGLVLVICPHGTGAEVCGKEYVSGHAPSVRPSKTDWRPWIL